MTTTLQALLDFSAEEITQADIEHVVHPTATVFQKSSDAIIFKSGKGIYLTDIAGTEWLDACGGQANGALETAPRRQPAGTGRRHFVQCAHGRLVASIANEPPRQRARCAARLGASRQAGAVTLRKRAAASSRRT